MSVGASLRLSAALTATAALALSETIFALLFDVNAIAAYAISLGLAAVLAVLGIPLSDRVKGEARKALTWARAAALSEE